VFAIGRAFRFSGEGWLAYKYGTVSVVVAGIVLLLGVLLILSRRRRQA
jgi:LPXTG-motif cell wall-anchored protein